MMAVERNASPHTLSAYERDLQDAEGFLFQKHAHCDKVADLNDEVSNLLQERHVCTRKVGAETYDLPFA